MTSHHDRVNPKQLEAIQHVEGPVMVIAGPGSGKTRTLTFRIAHLIQIGVPAYQILALTFTNKAANEMKARIVDLVGEKSKSLWMGTFHSILARILRTECEKINFHRNFSIYDTQDSLRVIKSIINDGKIPAQQYTPSSIASRISSAKNKILSPAIYAEQVKDIFEEKTAVVYQEYQRRLHENNAFDFDDLLIKPIELFQKHHKVLEAYQDRFRFILIDEYQDTNHAQYVLIKLLADKFKNLCVVGDDAQSIYAFRGADIQNILDFQRDYPNATIIRLEQNYRSTKTILAAADLLIKNNQGQISKDLWTENDTGETITVLACDDDKAEGESIVQSIYREVQKNKREFKHFSIMYRTNAQSRSLEDALRRNTIPYAIIGGVEFYQRKEIKDVLAYLRLLVNSQDRECFLRIANVPNRGIGSVAVSRLLNYAEENKLQLLDAAIHADQIPLMTAKAKSSLRAFGLMMRKYEKMKTEMSIGELSRSLVDEIGILQLLKNEATPEAIARWENIQELLSAVSEYAQAQEEATLENFLQEVSLVSDVDRWDDRSNAVTLMTLHSAKGLEFPVVFIAGLEEGLLPIYNSYVEQKDLEEERRLLYVGMTRAMEKLFLSHARVRFRFGEISYQSASRFLDEIGSDHIDSVVHRTANRFSRESSPALTYRKPVTKQNHEDTHFFADEVPDYESDSSITLRLGASVEHPNFGRGTVRQISGSGELLKIVVDFPSVGRKNLMAKYAHLKIV
jgi:DNA helicase II / ATP-dependent DNA helicase PcrA